MKVWVLVLSLLPGGLAYEVGMAASTDGGIPTSSSEVRVMRVPCAPDGGEDRAVPGPRSCAAVARDAEIALEQRVSERRAPEAASPPPSSRTTTAKTGFKVLTADHRKARIETEASLSRERAAIEGLRDRALACQVRALGEEWSAAALGIAKSENGRASGCDGLATKVEAQTTRYSSAVDERTPDTGQEPPSETEALYLRTARDALESAFIQLSWCEALRRGQSDFDRAVGDIDLAAAALRRATISACLRRSGAGGCDDTCLARCYGPEFDRQLEARAEALWPARKSVSPVETVTVCGSGSLLPAAAKLADPEIELVVVKSTPKTTVPTPKSTDPAPPLVSELEQASNAGLESLRVSEAALRSRSELGPETERAPASEVEDTPPPVREIEFK